MMINDMDRVRLIMYCFYTLLLPLGLLGLFLSIGLRIVLIPLMYLFFFVLHFYHIQVWGLFIGEENKSDI